MNHPEQLMSEWLQHRSYFVRRSAQVGQTKWWLREQFGVVGMHLERQHIIHVGCSANTLSTAKSEERISLKFQCGRRFIETVLHDLTLLATMKQKAVF